MAQLLSFDDHALARLRARLGAAEEARQDLIAFARGHSGAVSAIHQAVLAAIGAQGIDQLAEIVAGRWPAILAVDAVALAVVTGDDALLANDAGSARIETRLVARTLAGIDGTLLRQVERGHPLFGPSAAVIRAEALIAIDGGAGTARGLLAIGQVEPHRFDNRHGRQLLQFLGQSLAAIIGGWTSPPPR